MPIHPTDTIVPSEPGGALRLDARVASNVFAQSDGLRSIPQLGCVAQMYALNDPNTGVVTTFGGAGRPPQPIKYTAIDVDDCEFSDRPMCDPTNGTITLWQDGVYELGFRMAFKLIAGTAHVESAIWTDCGATSIALPPITNTGTALVEGQPYGTRWQRIAQRNHGYRALDAARVSSNPSYPWNGQVVRTVVCIRNPVTGAGGSPTFTSSLPAPCRFLTSIQADTTQLSSATVNGDRPGLVVFYARWLGEPN